QAPVCLRLTHPLPQRLGVNPEITGDVSDRAAALKRQPDAALKQLLRILPRPRHDSGGSPLPRTTAWTRGPRETQSGSVQRQDSLPHPQRFRARTACSSRSAYVRAVRFGADPLVKEEVLYNETVAICSGFALWENPLTDSNRRPPTVRMPAG